MVRELTAEGVFGLSVVGGVFWWVESHLQTFLSYCFLSQHAERETPAFKETWRELTQNSDLKSEGSSACLSAHNIMEEKKKSLFFLLTEFSCSECC